MKEILITSSVLIAALLLLRLLFAKKVRRTLIYGAWLLVALRLLIPVQIGQLDFSVLTAAQPLTETVAEFSELRVLGQNEREASIQVTKDYIEQDLTVFTPEVQDYIRSKQETNTPAEEIATAIVKTQGSQLYVPEVRSQVEQQVAEQTNFVSLGELATALWLVGAAVMVVWFAAVNLRQGRLLRQNREKLDCESPIPVYVSEKVDSPCLVGLFRPVIYLTPESGEREETRRHVLTHELTHYRHGDHVWSFVRCVCLCVYWFHPLVWVAAWFSRRDCELACDEGALKRLGEKERIAYGKSLLEVVSHASAPSHLLQTATSMNETKEQLKQRVEFIAKKPKWSLIAAVCMVLVCAIVAGCTAAGSTATMNEQWIEMYYQMETKEYKRGEVIEVKVTVKNTGIEIPYTGIPNYSGTLFSVETGEWYGAEPASIAFPDDATNYVFKEGDVYEITLCFAIPEDATIGWYNMNVWFFETKVEFAEVVKITDSTQQTPPPSSSTATNTTESVTPPSSSSEIPPESYWPETPENPSPDLLALTELFGTWGTLYNSALTSTYESPAFINLNFFLQGVSKQHVAQLTEEEQAAFADYGIENMEVFRYTRAEVDGYLQQYFGITSADLDEIAVRNLNYLESTDCFYIFTNGWDGHVRGVNVIFAEPQADGTVLMYYTTEGWPAEKLIARLQPTDSGYIILSNLRP